jgi:hypothetical protein
MPRLKSLRRQQVALAPARAAVVLTMGLLLGAMLTMLLQTAGEVTATALGALLMSTSNTAVLYRRQLVHFV